MMAGQALVLIGQTAKKIAVCADAHDFHDYVFADSLEEAIDIAYETENRARLFFYHRHVQVGACLTITNSVEISLKHM